MQQWLEPRHTNYTCSWGARLLWSIWSVCHRSRQMYPIARPRDDISSGRPDDLCLLCSYTAAVAALLQKFMKTLAFMKLGDGRMYVHHMKTYYGAIK